MLELLMQNLVLQGASVGDMSLLQSQLVAAISYAEEYQHVGAGFYTVNPMPDTTRQAVIMLASHWYLSRDGSTGGFFADSPAAAERTMKSVHDLLSGQKEWKI